MQQVRYPQTTSFENIAATRFIVYHVIFDFLKHVVIGHDEVLCCVPISNVGQDTQRLTKKRKRFSSVEWSKHSATKCWRTFACIHLFFDLDAVIGLENQSHRLHDLFPMRTHDLVDVLQTSHYIMYGHFQSLHRIKNIQDKWAPQKGCWWFRDISYNAFIRKCVCVCGVCLSLVLSTADFAEIQESSSAHLYQGLTGGGIAALYPNIEQSPPSPSDQPEMLNSEHKQFKSYRAGQSKEISGFQ